MIARHRTYTKISGCAFGRGMEDNIRNLYRFIAYNYQQNDELFFFKARPSIRSCAALSSKSLAVIRIRCGVPLITLQQPELNP